MLGRKAYLTPTMIDANEVNETSIFLGRVSHECQKHLTKKTFPIFCLKKILNIPMANFCFWKNIFSVKQAKKQVKDETDECGWSMKSFEQISWKKKTFFFHLLFVSIPFKDRLSTWISLRMHEILCSFK
jgi:hypothetical protein